MEMEIFPDDDPLPRSHILDDNGFPSPPSDSESEPDEEAKEGSFASDFYRSGTDWSCFKEEGKKTLVQKDLFQVWGLKNNTKPQQLQDSNKKRPFASNGGKGGSRGRQSGDGGNRRACPFYKKIPGTPFTVDAFRYGLIEGCKAYFLSHFHYDHYGGLSKGWSHGPVYCTQLTARLVRMCLRVNPIFIIPLELDVEHTIEGIKVTLLEANHCPGAALIHFLLPDGTCYLHTGDFRASKLMQTYPLLVSHKINVLYLDTTYCNPKYRFPSQEDVVNFVVKTSRNFLSRWQNTLVAVGAYSIGKEQVYLAISEALGFQIYANASRKRILKCFDWPQLCKKLCSNGHDTPLHVLPMSSLRHESLKQYMKDYEDRFTYVLAFRPTGWAYSESVGSQLDNIKPTRNGNITIYGVPYSEHSSFLELKDFMQFLRPEKIIPTVNIANASNRKKMQTIFQEWLKPQN